jgi:multiple sugar transport system permease protein
MTTAPADSRAKSQVGSGSSPRRRRRLTFNQRRRALAVALTLPALGLVTVFFFIPLGVMAWMSLNRWPLVGKIRFVGFDNYTDLSTEGEFGPALLVSTVFVLLVSPLAVLLGLGLALLIKTKRAGAPVFRSIYFLPLVIGFAPAAYIWLWLLNPDVGLFNRMLADLGLGDGQTQWLAETNTALLSAVSLFVWKTIGFSMLLLMGGLQSIPEDITDAAAVDGATGRGSCGSAQIPTHHSLVGELRPLVACRGRPLGLPRQ